MAFAYVIMDNKTHSLKNLKKNRTIWIFFFVIVLTTLHISCSENKKSSTSKFTSEHNATTDSKDTTEYNVKTESNYLRSISKYSILNISVNNKVKTVASIRIPNKIPDSELRLIATKAKSEMNPMSERVHLFFLLPEMKDNNGAWARADFNPDLQIYILGQTIASENSIKNYKKQNNKEVFLGQWTDDYYNADLIYRMRKDVQQGLVLELYSPSENEIGPFPTILKKSNKKGKTIYIDTNSPNQYFIINTKGDLVAYDESGYIVTYKKI